ncbi:hypothetical protein [Flammeovirga pacifica]|uniref:Uncharacterized protein n=1 Tax=Flammeovirga pacifica TaxID=915059 RepID=A0A1S1Z2K8_FLAPC|nr:hypothetical protein [Flammeovirga pacifica]OHX67481.1 hypothetical protein NH26_14565 [Flammeovirga pacifica]
MKQDKAPLVIGILLLIGVMILNLTGRISQEVSILIEFFCIGLISSSTYIYFVNNNSDEKISTYIKRLFKA